MIQNKILQWIAKISKTEVYKKHKSAAAVNMWGGYCGRAENWSLKDQVAEKA